MARCIAGSAWVGVALVAAYACGGSGTRQQEEGASCVRHSDCQESLRCALGRCHFSCEITEDCDGEARCVLVLEVEKVCQLEDEEECETDSDCGSPLVCGPDSKCRNECERDSDCVHAQECSTSGVCAEPAELDRDGNLLDEPAVGAAGSGGAAETGGSGGGNTGGGSGSTACIPGATQTCVGPGQCAGVQSCTDDGSRWGACDCGESTGGSGGSVGDGGMAGSGEAGASAGAGGGEPTGGDAGATGSGGSGNVTGTGGEDTGGTGGGVTGGTGGDGGSVGGGTGGDGGSVGGGAGGTGGTGGTGGVAGQEPILITSGQNDYWVMSQPTVDGGGSPTATVNENQTYQTWHGWGGTFNERGWEALQALSAADRARAISLLFDVNDGIGFAWGRIPIGASDYGLDRYTLCDSPCDASMAGFSISRDQGNLIQYIHAAQAVKPDIKFWASPWTPPPWMKDGGENGGYDKGVMKSDAATLDAFALYLVRFVQAYEGENIPIDFVMPQNEPGWAQAYPSCAWGPSTDNGNTTERTAFFGGFIENQLASAFQTAGLSTKIWFGTLSNNSTFDAYWNSLSASGRNLVEGVGLQWECVERVQQMANAGLLVMCSEHKCGNYPWLGTTVNSRDQANRDNFLPTMAPNNHAYGEESWDLIKEWIELGVNMYSAWNMVLDSEGFNMDEARPWPQNALLSVNMSAGTLEVTPAYYVFRHVAQYVEPGAVRVGVTGGNALAFQNPDGSIVTAMYNSQSSAAQTVLSVGGHTVSFEIPARGWATVNWQGG